MNKIYVFFLSLLLFCISSTLLLGQSSEEFQKKYLYGKALMKEGRYQAAAQVFLPLTVESDENAFYKPSAYFYALSSFKSNDFNAAKSMCLQTLQRYPDWEQKDDVYYILGNTYFEQKKPRLALQFLNKIEGLKKEVESSKQFYLPVVTPIDTLIALQRDAPEDILMVEILVKKINSTAYSEKEQMLLDFLVQEYKLKIEDLIVKQPTKKKSSYSVAVLFPFQLNEIDPKISKRSNQFVLDFNEGLNMALDSLKAKGIEVKLYTYDTERDTTVLMSILALPELKAMDMIIGPVFSSQVYMVKNFCIKNKIVNVNPFSSNSIVADRSEFTYMYQSTLELQVGTAARYANANFRFDSLYVIDYKAPKKPKGVKEKKIDTIGKNKVIVFYGNDLKDSLMAIYHKDSCIANNLEVVKFEKINRENIELLKTILSDTARLGKANHVFASTSDEVIAANIMSLMEISRQTTPLITRADWLDFELIAFKQFESRNVFFIHTDYYDYDKSNYKNFKATWIKRTGIYPSKYSLQGYELMLFFGQALGKYGTYFKYGLDEAGYMKGSVFKGFDYSYSFSNKYVPLTRFVNKNLVLVNEKIF